MATVMEKYTYPETSLVPRYGTPVKMVSGPLENRLLAALPDSERVRLIPHLERVDLPLGKVLYECGGSSIYVYFPTTAMVSLMHLLHDGSSAEIATVGRDGIVGVAHLMGGGTTQSRAVVQCAGEGYRLKSHFIAEEAGRAGPVLNLLLRYTHALMTQTAQTAVCNRHHCLDQQLCRWLLLTLDRLSGNEITMTQELIAGLLGVRREGVTAAAGRLQTAGLIRYRRGRISVLDREGLEKRACECYAVVRNEYARLLPAPQDSLFAGRILNLRVAAQSQRMLHLSRNAEV